MTLCDYIIFAILGIFMIAGFFRGLIREFFEVLFALLPIGLSISSTPYIVRFLKGNQLFLPTLLSFFEKKFDKSSYLAIFFNEKEELISSGLGEIFAGRLAYYIIFAIVYILTYIIIKIIMISGNIIAKLPILSGFNRFFGAVFGLAKGLLFVSMVMFLLSLAYVNFSIGEQWLKLINEGTMSSLLYQNNIIVFIIKAIIE